MSSDECVTSIDEKNTGREASENTETVIKRQKLDFLDEWANTPSNFKCIVTFKVGTTQSENIPVPCCLLAMKSPVFKEMFFGTLKETSDVEIPDAEPDTFKTFIRFLNTSSTELITEQNVCGLIYLANKYFIGELVHLCVQYVVSTLKITNVASVLNFNSLLDSRYLLEKTIEFIVKNQMQLFPSDYFNDCTGQSIEFLLSSSHLAVQEDKILNMLQTWVTAELKRKQLPENGGNERREILKPLLKFIRLHFLSRKTCTNLLEDEACPEEAKKDIRLLLEKESVFIAEYFCNSSRLSFLHVLHYNVQFVEKTDTISVSTSECKKIIIWGVLFTIVSTDIPFEIILEDEFVYNKTKEQQHILGTVEWGKHLFLVPKNGFIIKGKGRVQLGQWARNETPNMVIPYEFLPNNSFQCANSDNVVIRSGSRSEKNGLFGLLYQLS